MQITPTGARIHRCLVSVSDGKHLSYTKSNVLARFDFEKISQHTAKLHNHRSPGANRSFVQIKPIGVVFRSTVSFTTARTQLPDLPLIAIPTSAIGG